MRAQKLARFWLDLRLLLSRRSVVGTSSTIVFAATLAACTWLVQARDILALQRGRLSAPAVPQPRAAPAQDTLPAGDYNLSEFYRSLGVRKHTQRQLRTLFVLADQAGLVLTKGEYAEVFDPAAKLYRYQITLPVKGAHSAIWDFCMQVLSAIPSASLDEISFHRETIGDTKVEAHLRVTLYLHDSSGRTPR